MLKSVLEYVCAVRRSVYLDTGITVITGPRGTEKAREEKERGTDIEKEDTETGMNNTDPHAGKAQIHHGAGQ